MFCKTQNINLKATHTNDGLILWKEFGVKNDSFLIIGAAKGITKKVLDDLINLIFSLMIMSVGLNELQNTRNIEKLKRDLKPNLPVIDVLMKATESELLCYSDCILCPENYEILDRLNDFAEQVGSPFCFVLIRQKIAVATEGWWTLHETDRKLLISLMNASSTAQKDTAVYLPEKSPTIAYRLVSVPILQGVNICMLCGIEPSYPEIEQIVQHIWKNDLEMLALAEQCYPRNFPPSLEIDQGILGILLINKVHKKYVISRNVHTSSSGKRTISGTHRLDILRAFFHQSSEVINEFMNGVVGKTQNSGLATSSESYWCSEYHKCHSLELDDNLICILYVASIPVHTMRFVLKLNSEKQCETLTTFHLFLELSHKKHLNTS